MSEWFESLVQLRVARGEKGSGIFISPTEVLTAAHVVTRSGAIVSVDDVKVDIRFQSRLARPVAIATLPSWIATQSSGSDMALIAMSSEPTLGVEPIFGVPAPMGTAMLEGHGFVAQDDAGQKLAGEVLFKPPAPDAPFLFSDDFAPIPGMSGGPLVGGINGAVRVAGILTQRSNNQFIGLAMLASVLDTLRARL